MGDVAESSQTTQPKQSQIVDPTQVECLNYQDQIHDATDGGYDEQHIPDGGGVQQGEVEDEEVPVLDADDIATHTTLEILPDQSPSPEGPLDTSLLFSYAEHVALRL